jgi:hypothetical protein
MSNFWWGDGANCKMMHWRGWWKLCVPKDQGGMGFKDIHYFNLALLAKQVWRILEARVIRAKYFSNGDLLNAQMKKGSFFTWQSIWSGIQTFKKAIYGLLAMGVISISGKMNGFQITTQGRLLHQT